MEALYLPFMKCLFSCQPFSHLDFNLAWRVFDIYLPVRPSHIILSVWDIANWVHMRTSSQLQSKKRKETALRRQSSALK